VNAAGRDAAGADKPGHGTPGSTRLADDDQGDDVPEDLQQVMDAWSELPVKIRRQILDLIPEPTENPVEESVRRLCR